MSTSDLRYPTFDIPVIYQNKRITLEDSLGLGESFEKHFDNLLNAVNLISCPKHRVITKANKLYIKNAWHIEIKTCCMDNVQEIILALKKYNTLNNY